MKKILSICSFAIISFAALAQSNEYNLQKYWKYRERLKNCVVVGDCQGCSLPSSNGRGNPSGPIPNNDVSYQGYLNYPDEAQQLGYYIGMLGMEYRLQKDHGPIDQDQMDRTISELFYAIETINRLDIYAEYYWQRTFLNNPNYQLTINDLNGFFIRDDVSKDFGDHIYNNDLIENNLNNSLIPPKDGPDAPSDGHLAKTFASGFTSGTGPDVLKGPVEESLDQVVLLYTGLALVVKFVDNGQTFSAHNFMDGESDFVKEAKAICNRIYTHMRGNYIPFVLSEWNIINPATGTCPYGTAGGCHDNSCGPFACNGANVGTLSYGFLTANSYIQNDFNFATSQLQILAQSSADPVANLSDPLWTVWRTFPQFVLNGQQDKVLSLAAIGNTWYPFTSATISYHTGFYSLPPYTDTRLVADGILHQLLHGTPNLTFSPSFFECLLDHAPCAGTVGNDLNLEWAGGQRLNYGVLNNDGDHNFDQEWNGIDYMFLFNMYNLVNPGYCNYRFIPPNELLNDVVTKTAYDESDHKRFYAATTVNTSGHYRIFNDNDLQPLPYKNAAVEFKAGHTVELNPGFIAESGVLFTASIDPSLKQIVCTDPSDVNDLCGNPNRILDPGLLNSNNNNDLLTDIIIGPNPCRGTCYLYSPIGVVCHVEVYDLLGRVVFKMDNVVQFENKMDLEGLAKGAYEVVIASKKGSSKLKLIIE